MKILAIRGRNIASLDGDFELDFTAEPLASAGIFAICGPTGAGKSTLLDALCLALFARTPRTDRARENEIWIKDVSDSSLAQGDPRSLLRRGAASGYAEADFSALNGRHYRARWTVRRARDKETGSLQGFKVSLFDLDTGREESGSRKEVQARIAELIGLTFEQFTRSVLLAQNDFSTFLKADQSEKAALLEKLTGTEYFSFLSQSIYRCASRAKEEYEQVHARVEGVELLPDEEIGRIGETLRRVETALKTLRNEKSILETKLNWFREREALQASVEQAKGMYEAADRRRRESRDRADYLRLSDDVQEARSLYDAEKNTGKSRAEKEAERERLESETERLSFALEDGRRRYDEQTVRLQTLEKDYVLAEPVIREARRLDTQLVEATRMAEEAENDWRKAAEQRRLQESRLQELDQLLQRAAEETARLSGWQEKHRSREHVAEQIAVLRLHLNQAGSALEIRRTALSRKEALAAEAVRQEQAADAGRSAVEQKGRELEEAEKALVALEAEQRAADPEALRAALGTCRKQQETVAGAISCWNEYLREQAAWQQLRQTADELRIRCTAAEQESERLRPLLAAAEVRKQESEKIYNRAVWAAAGDAEKMRSHLEEGEPCPVCGSPVHPYVRESNRLQQTLSAIRREVSEAVTAYDETWKSTERLRQQLVRDREVLRSREEEIRACDERVARLQETWQTFTLPGAEETEPEQRAGWLARLQVTLAGRSEQLLRQEEACEVRGRRIQQYLRQRSAVQEELSALRRVYEACMGRRTLIEEKKKAEAAVIAEQEKLLEEALRATDELFGHEKWRAAWTADAGKFREQLEEFAETWKQKKEALQAQQQLTVRSAAEQQTVRSFLPALKREEAAARQRADERRESLRRLQADRAALLGGEPADRVEKHFREQVEAAKKSSEILRASLHRQTVAYEQHKAAADRVVRDLAALQEEAARQRCRLDDWIAGFNRSHVSPLSYEALAGLLSLDPAWLLQEREALRQIESEWVAARARLQEREAQAGQCEARRTALGIGSDTPDGLRTAMEQLDARIRETEAGGQECAFRLRQQEENKRKVEGLLAELEKKRTVCDQWAKLNELAGSADGGKFRRIAQGYTLDVLLEYANVQLRMLSRRYRLERVPDTLALQVIDRDMCDEVRTVHSLSGGESFLVSLALALGLSSLSSNRMQVESLFIDEGFGSLDAETLRTAMDVLESLHTQGRKIGVISHVQEMTERIPVRVRVEKQGNGRSCLSITG